MGYQVLTLKPLSMLLFNLELINIGTMHVRGEQQYICLSGDEYQQGIDAHTSRLGSYRICLSW